MTAIRSKLLADSGLTALIGANRVFRRAPHSTANLPCVTLQDGNESSTPQVSYAIFKKRWQDPSVQIDVWVDGDAEDFPNTGEDASTIADQIDTILLDALNPVSITRMWKRVSSTEQWEDDERTWHIASRYEFMYTLTDD
jgi:hypothetical protein